MACICINFDLNNYANKIRDIVKNSFDMLSYLQTTPFVPFISVDPGATVDKVGSEVLMNNRELHNP
jgi:hypothetical protein